MIALKGEEGRGKFPELLQFGNQKDLVRSPTESMGAAESKSGEVEDVQQQLAAIRAQEAILLKKMQASCGEKKMIGCQDCTSRGDVFLRLCVIASRIARPWLAPSTP